MPSNDLIVNVQQVAGYPLATSAQPTDSLLIQQTGLGGPYASISPEDLVGTALANGGDMTITGTLTAFDVTGGSLAFSNGSFGLLSATNANFFNVSLSGGTINGDPIAGQNFVANSTVASFNFRRGDVVLNLGDILGAGGAPIDSPHFVGVPTAPTAPLNDNSDRIATTMFVQQDVAAYIQYLLQTQPFVFTFNGRSGDIVLTAQDIINAGGTGEIFNDPIFTGDPQAPTPPPGDNDQSVATTAFVQNAITNLPYAPINSPAFSGNPTAPTATPGSSDGQIATTAFVMNAVTAATAGVASFNTRTGAVVLTTADITGAGGAILNSPAFIGTPTAPTAAPNTNTTQLATCAYVMAATSSVTAGVTSFNTRTGAVVLTPGDITTAGGALANNSALTGVPTAPTAALNANTTQIATTAFVMSQIQNGAVASFNGRTGTVTLQGNDLSGAGGALINSPTFTGIPAGPTAAPGTNSTQLATTAFVTAALGTGNVTSFNTRTGAVVLQAADLSSVGGALLASPTFSGNPTAPTQPVGNNSTSIATTAFVAAALGSGVGVSSFNGRTGVVSLTGSDITGAGGALLASPALTGSPTAPTPATGNNSTQLATTAFVQAQITAGAVQSFNGRTGAVTFQANDISAVGGALLASPVFTGTPVAPTAAPGTNTGALATTAFVEAALSTLGSTITVGPAPPGSPQQGNLWWDSTGGQLYVFYNDGTSSQWVIAVNQNAVATTSVGVNPPPSPLVGQLWYNLGDGQTYAWVDDGNSQQWVVVVNQGGAYVAIAGGTMQGPLALKGVTDGSDALPGMVGEVISSIVQTPGVTLTNGVTANVASIALTPGDWDIHAETQASLGTGGANSATAGINSVSATLPGGATVSLSSARVQITSTLTASNIDILTCACRASVSATTTFYQLVNVNFTGGTCTAYGKIWARRAR